MDRWSARSNGATKKPPRLERALFSNARQCSVSLDSIRPVQMGFRNVLIGQMRKVADFGFRLYRVFGRRRGAKQVFRNPE